jgi:hydrogenase maturation protease
MASAGKTLVVGLGSPILRDDAIGLRLVRALADRLPSDSFEIVEAGAAGLRLLPLLEGWERVIFVDALLWSAELGTAPSPGRLHQLAPDRLHPTLTLHSSHEPGLADTLALGRQAGMALPEQVLIFGVEVRDPFTFDERMTPELEANVPALADEIAGRCPAS